MKEKGGKGQEVIAGLVQGGSANIERAGAEGEKEGPLCGTALWGTQQQVITIDWHSTGRQRLKED